MNNYHTPVMLTEVLRGLQVTPGKKYIDATIGGGGHSEEIVKSGGILLGIDQDPDAIEYATERLSGYPANLWTLTQGNFRNIEKIAAEHGFKDVQGILFDLGVSSHQIDTEDRGFSYRYPDAKLDLRMDQSKGEPANSLINRIPETDLYEILVRFAELREAREVAKAISIARRKKEIETTGDLVRIIKNLIKNDQHVNSILSQVFQGLRIAVNDELNALSEGLSGAKTILSCGGRIAVISFHSLEDRTVKQFLKKEGFKFIESHALTATREELLTNKRARSAKLRIAEKVC